MGHFAKIENNIVINVIVAEQEVIDSGIVGDPTSWVQTSYNTRGGIHYAPNSNTPDGGVALRANFAGIGHTYDRVNDVLYAPKPYPSWTISSPDWIWKAPISYPDAQKLYDWDEPTLSWIEITT